MKNTIMYKLLKIVVIIIASIFVVDFSFTLMNQKSTVQFVLGFLILVALIGFVIDLLIKHTKKSVK